MKLREYLDKNKISISDFARQSEFTRTYLSLLLSGKTRISPRTAKLLAMSTKGEVSEEELLSMHKDGILRERNTKKNVDKNRDK